MLDGPQKHHNLLDLGSGLQKISVFDFTHCENITSWDSKRGVQFFCECVIYSENFFHSSNGDGKTSNLIPDPVTRGLTSSTNYKHASKLGVVKWNEDIELATLISTLDLSSQLVINIYQTTLSQDEHILVGGTAVPLFDQETGVLITGDFECIVWPKIAGMPEKTPYNGRNFEESASTTGTGEDNSDPLAPSYHDLPKNIDRLLEVKKKKQLIEQGVLPAIPWLDQLVTTPVEKLINSYRSSNFLYLKVKFPKFTQKGKEVFVIFSEPVEKNFTVFTNIYEETYRKKISS